MSEDNLEQKPAAHKPKQADQAGAALSVAALVISLIPGLIGLLIIIGVIKPGTRMTYKGEGFDLAPQLTAVGFAAAFAVLGVILGSSAQSKVREAGKGSASTAKTATVLSAAALVLSIVAFLGLSILNGLSGI